MPDEISLLDELDTVNCWCGRDEDVCEENGGCRWSAVMSAAEGRTAAAELKVTLLRAVLLEGGQDDATARRRALAIIGTEGASNGGLRQRPGDQQLPVPNDGPSMHDLAADDVRRRHPGGRAPEIHAVIRDLAARKQLGLDRYGSLLQAHNGRDVLRDLHEEQLDAIVYCRQWLAENDEEHPYAAVVRLVYRDLLTGALTVRRVMDDAAVPAAGAEPGNG